MMALGNPSMRPVRVRCPLGGYAPCIDDLCYGGGQTVCGLYADEDFCYHGYYQDTCDQGCSGDDLDDEIEWMEEDQHS